MPGPASQSLARLIGRLSIAFVLDLVKHGRKDVDMMDALISVAIIQANLVPVTRDQDLQRAYATYDQPVPDDLRRPVSISSVAGSLKMSYETVRRRVTAMAAIGFCEITDRGVMVSSAALSSEEHRQVLARSYDAVRAFYVRLRELGMFEEAVQLALRSPEHHFSAPPLRAVSRLWADYFLRVIETIRHEIGHPVAGLLVLAILRANTEHLSDDERGTDSEGQDGYVPDERRRPVRVVTLAARLGLPEETARRHVAQLIRDGRCVRVPGGILITSEIMARGRLPQVLVNNMGHLNRMFAGIAQLGVLAEWERDREAIRGVA